jgi:hypothetical protein
MITRPAAAYASMYFERYVDTYASTTMEKRSGGGR